MNEFPPARFNRENAEKAFAAVAASSDFDLIRWALLGRYAEVRQLLSSTDGGMLNRALGKCEELEWALEQFGVPPYGGLPLADGTSGGGTASAELYSNAEIGGGYPGGIRQPTPVVNPGPASGS